MTLDGWRRLPRLHAANPCLELTAGDVVMMDARTANSCIEASGTRLEWKRKTGKLTKGVDFLCAVRRLVHPDQPHGRPETS
jgi:hypothetical protein